MMYVMRSLFEDGSSGRRRSSALGTRGRSAVVESQNGEEKAILPVSANGPKGEDYSFEAFLEELREEGSAADGFDDYSEEHSSDDDCSFQLLKCLQHLSTRSNLEDWRDLQNDLQRYHQALLESATCLAEMTSRADRIVELLMHSSTTHVMDFAQDEQDVKTAYHSLLAQIPTPLFPPILTGATYRDLKLFRFLTLRAFPGSLRQIATPIPTADDTEPDRHSAKQKLPLFTVAIPHPPTRPGAAFPIEDFFPNLKQDFKDACRDTFQCGDTHYKGSEYSTYKMIIKDVLGPVTLEDPQSEEAQAQLRRHLVRILLIMHFLQRTFSGTVIFQCLSDLLNLDRTASDVHLVPRSADAGTIKIHFLGNPRNASIYASSNLSFTLVHNDESTGLRVRGRLTLNIPNLADFGLPRLLDQIGDAIGINPPPFRECNTQTEFLDLLWPLDHTPKPLTTHLSDNDFFSIAKWIHLYFENIS